MEESSVAQWKGARVSRGALPSEGIRFYASRQVRDADLEASGELDKRTCGAEAEGAVAARRATAARKANLTGGKTGARAEAVARGSRGALVAKRVGVIVVAVLLVMLPLAWLGSAQAGDMLAFLADGDRVRAWVDEHDVLARLVFVAAVALQIVVAVLPGGPLEVAGGYAFGAAECAALCLLGAALGTLVVVALVRTLGMRVVSLFFRPEKIASLKWFRDARRFEMVMFLCFLIPGVPKDILTYVAALSACPSRRIVLLTTLGRAPAVVVSALAGDVAAQGDWMTAAAIALIALALVAVGGFAYAAIRRRAEGE